VASALGGRAGRARRGHAQQLRRRNLFGRVNR